MLPTPPPSPQLKGAAPSSDDLIGQVLPCTSIELQGVLGIGAYGTVYIAQDLATGVSYAVKALNKVGLTPRQTEFLEQEIRLHQLASSHPNVVSLVNVVETANTNFVVLEYCPEGDLFGNITEHSRYVGDDLLAKRIFLQLLDAVEYCHSIGIYHRDLKPENILITDGGMTAKLADFGLACTESSSSDFGCGSTFYMSPECLQSSPKAFSCYNSAANDVWALGICLINLTCGRNPWKKASVQDATFAAYLHDSSFLQTILPLSDHLDWILRRIFECEPTKRVTIPELREMIYQCPVFTTTGQVVPAEFIPCYVQVQSILPDYVQPTLVPQLSHFTNSSDGDWVYSNATSPASLSPSSTNTYPYDYNTTVATKQTAQPEQESAYLSASPNSWYATFMMPALDLAQKHMSFHPIFPGMRFA